MWNTLCLESFCFADQIGNKYPCGQDCPTHFCLGDKEFGMCPHFAWGITSERETAIFVPLRLLIWDRVKIWVHDLSDSLSWIFWGQLWFNRKKVEEFFNSIPVISAKDDPTIAKWEENNRKRMFEFTEWFEQAKLNAVRNDERD